MDLSVYGALWRTPGVVSLLAAAVVARLPVMATAVPMAFLAKDAAGNFGWAGVVAGTYSVGTAVGGPIWARVADRRGGKGVVLANGTVWSLIIAVLALLPADLYRLMPIISALAGAMVAPVSQTLRAAWPRLLDGKRLRAMYSLDASAQEIMFVFGPMLGAILVSTISPRAGLLLFAAAAAASIWWYGLRQPPAVEHDEAAGARLTARQLVWHRHRLPLILAFGLCVTSFASISLGIVAFADHRGDRLIAGVLESVWAIGSLVGGLVAGALPGRRTSHVWRRALLVAVGYGLCALATWSTWLLGVTLFLAGLVLAPTVSAMYERLGALTPATVRTEVFGWMTAGGMGGAAIGSALSGLVVETFGVRSAWLLAGLLTLGAALTVIRVPPLAPVEPMTEPVRATA